MKELLFLFVLFVSNVIQAITGFAGTVLAMPPSVYLLGLDHAKVVLNVMAWLSGLMIAVTGYRHINWKELLKIYATQVLKEKEEFRATVAPVWVVLNFFLMVTQFRSGLVGTADIRLICISILPLLIATWLGKKLVCKVSQKVFLNLTYILLLISGVSLIV